LDEESESIWEILEAKDEVLEASKAPPEGLLPGSK